MIACGWFGWIWLLLAGVVVLRAFSRSVLVFVLAVLGSIAASYLVLVFLVLSLMIPSWHRCIWRPIERRVNHLMLRHGRPPLKIAAMAAEPDRTHAVPAEQADGSLTSSEFALQRAEIERQWQQGEIERRLWHAGSLSGGLLAWLLVAATYFKLDLASDGRYRNRLRLASAAGLSLATAAAAWAWTVPI